MSKANFKISSLFALLLSLVACGGNGSSSNPNTPNNNNQPAPQTITVPNAIQLNTPLSISAKNASTSQSIKKLGTNSNSCFALKDMGGGKNYSLSYNSSQWWSTVNLSYTITNTCATSQGGNITANIAGFQVNGTNVNSLSNYIANTGSPYISAVSSGSNGNFGISMPTPNCSGDYCSWAQFPAGASKTFTVEYTLGQAVSSATVSSVTLGGTPPPPPPPVESGNIAVNLDGSQLSKVCSSQSSCNFTVSYSSSGLSPQSFSYNPYTDPTKTVTINNLNAGVYTFSVSNTPSSVTQQISPPQVTVTGGTTASEAIKFIYNAPVTTGNIIVNLAKITDSSDYTNLSGATGMLLQLTDETNSIFSQNCNVNMGNSCTFSNLPSNDKYHVTVQGVGDALKGIYYNAESMAVVVNPSATSNYIINYKKVSNNLQTTSFAVSGLESTATTPTVQFADSISNYKYISNPLQTGNYQFVNGEVVAITASLVAGYQTPEANPKVINAGTTTAVNIVYTKAKPSSATFNYIAPFKDYNNKITLSIQGLSSGNTVTFQSNFNPGSASGYGKCFGGSYPTLFTTKNSDGTYTTSFIAPAGNFDFNQTSCDIYGTNSGNAVILPSVVDPVVYSLSVDNAQLAFNSPCTATLCKDPTTGYVNAGYYAEWSVWGRQYNPYNMPFNNINNIIFAFVGFDGNTGNIKSLDTAADSWGFSAITRAMRQYPYMHASLSFGGWTNNGVTTAPMFMQLSSSQASMTNFANQAIALMRATGFDGIDLDWEWWSDYPNTQAPAKQTLAFFQVVRNALNQASAKDGKKYYLTLAVNGGKDRILAMQDTINNPNAVANYWSQIATTVDRINIMSYDYHGGFSAGTPAYFQANFNFANVSASTDVGQTTGWSIQDAVNTYIANSVNSKQIVIGIPLYARTMKVASGTDGGLFQNVIGAGYGDYEQGILDYKCLINPVIDPVNGCGSANPIAGIISTTFYNSTATGTNLSLYNTYGKGAMQSWGYSPSTSAIVSYDDVVAATAKTNYSKTNNLGGVMFWELDGDSTNPNSSIVQATKNALAQ